MKKRCLLVLQEREIKPIVGVVVLQLVLVDRRKPFVLLRGRVLRQEEKLSQLLPRLFRERIDHVLELGYPQPDVATLDPL